MTKQHDTGRTTAEWLGLAVSGVIVATLLALVVGSSPSAGTPPARLEVHPQWPSAVSEAGDMWVPIDIVNTGSAAATQIEVTFTFPDPGAGTSLHLTLDQLAPGEQTRSWLRVPADSRPDGLVTRMVYLEP